MPRRCQLSTEEHIALKAFIRHGTYPEDVISKSARQDYRRKAQKFSVGGDFLYFETEEGKQIVFSDDDLDGMTAAVKLQHEVMFHAGINQTHERIKKMFYNVPISIVKSVVSSCQCKKFDPLKKADPMVHIVENAPMSRIQIDLVDLHSFGEINDGFCWFLSIVDVYSKFGQVFPQKQKTASEVLKNLKAFFRSYGHPKVLQSDNGKEFCNQILVEYCSANNVQIKHGRPRHPQSQGQVERFNQTVTRKIGRTLGRSPRWIDDIADLVFPPSIVQ